MDYISIFEKLNLPYRENEPMDKHTTFKIGGAADYFCEPYTYEEVKNLISLLKENDLPYFVFGNGSNLLVSDLGINGAVIKIGGNMSNMTVTDNIITVDAGARLSSLCSFALEHSLAGLQFGWGIPGTVGGAIYMNAGAYGGEIKNVILDCTYLDEDGTIKTLDAKSLNLSYRNSIFKQNGGIILSARFKLNLSDKNQIRMEMDSLIERRKLKQPLEYPSAGSTFKRPEGNFAGTLIESAGLKGTSVGGAEVSTKHAGFIINKGGATASDVRRLIEKVKETVFLSSSIKLEEEVIFIGR